MDDHAAQRRWNDWYEFARLTLAYGHGEAVEYANRRLVEEQNHETLHRADARAGA